MSQHVVLQDGLRLVYEDHRGDLGEAQVPGPALLFVHGWSCDRSFFAPQVRHFARTRRVVAVDLRGHGESDAPRGPYPLHAFADDLATLADHLDLGPSVVVGHSMGAWIALQLADDRPDLVAATVLVDPTPFDLVPERRARSERLVRSIEAGDRNVRHDQVELFFRPDSDPELVETVRRAMLRTADYVAAEAMRGILAFDALPLLRRCRVPTLHIAATVPANPPEQMSAWLPTISNRSTEGAGHFVQLEAPEHVIDAIEDFLRRSER